MDTVFDRYEIEVIPDKAPATQVGYRQMMSNLHQFFGRMDPKDLRQHNAALYRDKRKVKAPTQANRELQLLSTVCTMAVEWGAMELHPLRGLRKVPTRPRDRYVSDAEYVVTIRPMIRCLMDLGLLTGLRRTDICRLTRDNVTDAGLLVRPGKTENTTAVEILFEWTPALHQVVKEALTIKPQFRRWIVCNRKGEQYTKNGFDSVWQRLMVKAVEKGQIERFQFRDIRAKNASDEPDLGIAQARLGHASSEITERVYVRTAKKVRPLR